MTPASASPSRARLAAEKLAVWCGSTLNVVGRSIPGVVGPLLVIYGLYTILGRGPAVLFTGVLVWLLDRRV